MENIKKYRIVIIAVLLLFLTAFTFGWIEMPEGWSLIIRMITYVLLIALSVWILVNPTKPRK